MLTIREPISLKIHKPMQSVREDMAEKMKANYGIMNTLIRKEELLHITSEPPEIYFAEGNDLNLFTNIKNENVQEVRLDVINNLLNRIMVSQTENFTYQDTVYISSILRKLGIRDEKTFMKQVFALQNEHKETNNLLKKYESSSNILKQLFVEEKERRAKEEAKEDMPLSEETRWYIHDEIFKRLETAKVYQDMRSFTKGVTDVSRQIFRTELNVGEQSTLINNFKLNAIKNEITGSKAPLYFFRNNEYEFVQEMEENITENVEEQISAAILLNIADQVYALRQEKVEENNHYWYSVAGALFQSAENTWKRYEANLLEQKKVVNNITNTLEQVNETKRIEGDTIEKIVKEYTTLSEQIVRKTENNNFINVEGNVYSSTGDIVNIDRGSFHLTKEELELNFLKNEEEEEKKKEPVVTAAQLKKQLEVFNERNIENFKKLSEIEATKVVVKDKKLDRKKVQLDALRAIENPQEVLVEYLTKEVKDPVEETRKQIGNQIYELFSEDTKAIYRTFLEQNTTSDTTVLQHIMNHPQETVMTYVDNFITSQEVRNNAEIQSTMEEIKFRNMNFIHKVEERIDTEELMETIKLQQQKIKKEETIEEVTIQKNKVNERTIHETINNVQVTKMEDIEEMVQQSVKRQMGRLSDQVYGKLEKKLQTERKRRGY